MTIEHRSAPLRASKRNQPGVTLHAIRPGVVDEYGSIWSHDTFDASLSRRLPTLVWAHNWSEPLGRATGYRTSPRGPEIDFTFSDFDDVPTARRAYSQVRDGTIRDCSVGFSNVKRRDLSQSEQRQFPSAKEVITRAQLDEVSLVLRGAVPGAEVVGVRGTRQATGPITDADVREAIAIAERHADREIYDAIAIAQRHRWRPR